MQRRNIKPISHKELVDIIISGQAFHWFESEDTKKEFLRILKPDGYVVIFSNRRKSSNNHFMNEYSELISKYSQIEFSHPLNTDLPNNNWQFSYSGK